MLTKRAISLRYTPGVTITLPLLQLQVTPFKYKERRPSPSEARVRPTPPHAGRKVLKPKGLLQTPPGGAPLVAPDPESIGTIPGQLVQVSKEEVVDNVHIGDVAKYSFYDQVTLQAKVKEDNGAVTWVEPVMVQFPMWMKGHAVGRDRAAVFIGGTLYQIKGDSRVTCGYGVCTDGRSSSPSVFNGQGWRVTSQALALLLLRRWVGQWREGSFSLRQRLRGRGRQRRGQRRAMTLTNRGTVLVCPVPRNQSLVPRGWPRLQSPLGPPPPPQHHCVSTSKTHSSC